MKKTIIAIALLLASSFAFADPVSLSKTEAFELHAALTALAPGLSPDTTLLAADAINALEADAKAFRTGYSKLLQLQQSATTPEAIAKFKIEDEKFAAVADDRKVYELPILTITKEDIVGTRAGGNPGISTATIATIKRLLRSTGPKK